jgi:hypothetical protein
MAVIANIRRRLDEKAPALSMRTETFFKGSLDPAGFYQRMISFDADITSGIFFVAAFACCLSIKPMQFRRPEFVYHTSLYVRNPHWIDAIAFNASKLPAAGFNDREMHWLAALRTDWGRRIFWHGYSLHGSSRNTFHLSRVVD